MSGDERKQLIIRPSSDLRRVIPSAPSVMSRIVTDVITIARSQTDHALSTKIRVGKHVLNEPDYRQLSYWAHSLQITTEDMLTRLEAGTQHACYRYPGEMFCKPIEFRVEAGSIVGLVWDFSSLPLSCLQCAEDLQIREIEFICQQWAIEPADVSISLNLSFLRRLRCQTGRIRRLEIMSAPALIELDCIGASLDILDLSGVPNLERLTAPPLLEINLSNCRSLREFHCYGIEGVQLAELDLSNVPALTHLACSSNNLTDLDLSNVSALTILHCDENQLSNLDLSNMPALTDLDCSSNQLTEIDVRGNLKLKMLKCDPDVNVVKHEWQSFPDAD